MRETGTCTRVQIASVVAGIGIMSAIGGATLAHTHDMTATTLALLASAVGLALRIREVLSAFPEARETKVQTLLDGLGTLWRQNPDEKIVVFATYHGTVGLLGREIEGTFPGQGVVVLRGGDHGAKTAAEPHVQRSIVLLREGVPLIDAATGEGLDESDPDRPRIDGLEAVFGETPELFVRVGNDAMAGAGVRRGDLVAITQSREPKHGELVAAQIGDAIEMRRFERTHGVDMLETEPEKWGQGNPGRSAQTRTTSPCSAWRSRP